MTTTEMYELLKRKDEEIAALYDLVEAMRHRIAEAMAEDAESKAWERAYKDLGRLFYEQGFKSDGRWRG